MASSISFPTTEYRQRAFKSTVTFYVSRIFGISVFVLRVFLFVSENSSLCFPNSVNSICVRVFLFDNLCSCISICVRVFLFDNLCSCISICVRVFLFVFVYFCLCSCISVCVLCISICVLCMRVCVCVLYLWATVLRRLKTYLRATMSQNRLNHIIILHTHKSYTDNLNITDIAREFVACNERRQSFFGSP